MVLLSIMPKKSDSQFDVVSETGNWNVAKSFSEYKIMKPLAEISRYFIMAKFGVEHVEENYNIPDDILVFNRLEGIKHVHYRLIRVINDNSFAIKPKRDKEKMKMLKKTLYSLQRFMNELSVTIVNQRDNTRAITIDETKFYLVFNILEEINSDLMKYLNNSDLIYNSTDDIDPDEFLKKIQEDIIHGG